MAKKDETEIQAESVEVPEVLPEPVVEVVEPEPVPQVLEVTKEVVQQFLVDGTVRVQAVYDEAIIGDVALGFPVENFLLVSHFVGKAVKPGGVVRVHENALERTVFANEKAQGRKVGGFLAFSV